MWRRRPRRPSRQSHSAGTRKRVNSAGPSPQLLALQSAVAGRYSIEREIGRGGMGVVYLGRDVALDRPVALKVLPPADAWRPEVRERFLREARTAARLSHPNIVPIFSVEEAGEFVFFVMAYVEGETLRHRIARQGPLPVATGARLLRDVAWALAYAHAQGVVHRDVKPENILLEAGSDRALVTDFGIAQVRTAHVASDLEPVVGTPEFMSPEQASGEPVDHRSDLYAFGVVAFYVFAGKPPFDGRTAPAILAQHIATPPPSLSTAAPGIPRAIATLVDTCLAKDPSQRVQKGEQVAEALAASLERRRDVPPAVRVFIAERKEAEAGTMMVVVMGPWLSLAILGLLFSREAALTAAGMVVLALLVAVPMGHTIASTRRLLKAGYGWDDAVRGLEHERERRDEELAHRYGRDHERDARRLRRAGALGISLAVAMLVAIGVWPELAGWLGAGATVPTILGSGIWYRGDRRTDTKGKRRLKRWRGALGRLLFRVAGMGLKVKTEAPALTQQPTELAIGMVVEGLFESLPKAARGTLGDLPQVVRSLEADAQQMRQRIRELDGLIADASLESRRQSDPEAGGVLEQLRASRGHAVRRLAESVGALEQLRIDLLRLRAGSITLEGVTANLGAARELTEQVGRLLAGYAEVERTLKA